MKSRWTKYIDAGSHPELKDGKKYAIKTELEGWESYARFVIYAGGMETDFLSLGENRGVGRVIEFRELDKDIDIYKPE